jgi:hypothetical protein
MDLATINSVAIPNLNNEQLTELANLHRELESDETSRQRDLIDLPLTLQNSTTPEDIQATIDKRVAQILNLGEYAPILVRDFTQVRLQFNKGKIGLAAVEVPSQSTLHAYGTTLKQELDRFTEGSVDHTVQITQYRDLVVCTVIAELASRRSSQKVEIVRLNSDSSPREIWNMLSQRFSQWVYVQRGLRVFGPSSITKQKPCKILMT